MKRSSGNGRVRYDGEKIYKEEKEEMKNKNT